MERVEEMQRPNGEFTPSLQTPEVLLLYDDSKRQRWKGRTLVPRHWILGRVSVWTILKMRLLVIALLLTLLGFHCLKALQPERSFTVDWENDRFLKDGKPFRFIAGSFHYFRAHPDSWQRKLRTMRAAGLNAVTTYVEWSLHNPKDGLYKWGGMADFERFIREAESEDLLVILRPGPYICAERDFGGFPYWLLTKYPNINLRTSDINYLHEVRKWYSVLMPRITPYLYGNGGPIIMVQVENEYGTYYACDKKYRTWLRDETLEHVQDNAVIFTNDGVGMLPCGHFEGVLATMDFGIEGNLTDIWQTLREFRPNGPLVDIEYYPGWMTHWSETLSQRPTDKVVEFLIKMLDGGANINFYMFYGGTNFGFTAGATAEIPTSYQPGITSYDYDAPMDEAGDPTPKYYKLREAIGRYLPLPNITLPTPVPKMKYGKVRLARSFSILSDLGRKHLAKGTFAAQQPLTFEALDQYSGFVLYETVLPRFKRDPSILNAAGVRDRAYVFVDDVLQGVLSRETPIYQLPLMATNGQRLQLLVENQGHINQGNLSDFKGLISEVKLDNTVLSQWNMTTFPLELYADIQLFLKHAKQQYLNFPTPNEGRIMQSGPTIFHGVLNIASGNLGDTYLDTSGWSKGVVFVNGENLGRYWPTIGPQITLYVPREVLRIGENNILLIENQNAEPKYEITFTNTPNLDGLQ